MDPHTTAVALLFSVEPTDRALQGWHSPTWLALGDRAVTAPGAQPGCESSRVFSPRSLGHHPAFPQVQGFRVFPSLLFRHP
jgi:hypothetical protein